ncbi:polymorphic transmembrane cluster 2 transmembrane protein 3, partial [Biomphalaria pfeifferi]
VLSTIMQASNSINWPADSLRGVFYYSATCQFYYNISMETVGNYAVHVSMFPNISNEARIDIAHGINTTLNISF